MTRALGFIFAVVLGALAHPAAAQERVYRCGDSYSQQPCAGGAAVPVDDARSAQQRAQSQQVAQRDAQFADALARQRERAEQMALRQGPAIIGSPVRVAHDATTCRKGASCVRDRSKAQRDKAERVTLYRSPLSN